MPFWVLYNGHVGRYMDRMGLDLGEPGASREGSPEFTARSRGGAVKIGTTEEEFRTCEQGLE